MREACGDAALPYHTVANWVKALQEGMDAFQDNLRTGRPQVENNTVQLLASLLDADLRWTVISGSLSISQNGAPHSTRHSGLLNTSSALDTHEISEVR